MTKMSASNSVGSTVSFFAEQELNVIDVEKSLSDENSPIIIERDENNTGALDNSLDIMEKDYL